MAPRTNCGGEGRGARLRSDRPRWSPHRRRCAHWSGSRRDARRSAWRNSRRRADACEATTLAASVARPREAATTIVGRLVVGVRAAVGGPHCRLQDAEEGSRMADTPTDSLEVVLGEPRFPVDQARWELPCRRLNDQGEKLSLDGRTGFNRKLGTRACRTALRCRCVALLAALDRWPRRPPRA